MVFNASLPASAMVSPVCKNENTAVSFQRDDDSDDSFRERERERERERNERYKTRDEIPQRKAPRTTTTTLTTTRAKTYQTPHAADDKPVGNPRGNRADADESRERRSRIRSHLSL